MARRGRRRRGHEEEHGNDERWLLTYSDMITLLMALFMVLFSISSVNKSKFETLQQTLKEAFSGRILPGGKSIVQAGGNESSHRVVRDAATSPRTARADFQALQQMRRALAAARLEDAEFLALKARIDAYARAHGLAGQLQTQITRRGLRIRLLTDRVVFDSGRADLKPQAGPILGQIATLLRTQGGGRQIQVDGHTDNVPVRVGPFRDNWDLSSARATTVVRFFIHAGLRPGLLSAGGFAANHPVVSNATAQGRARNRRVEILLARRSTSTTLATEGQHP
jgi:chemotaxis protein MotB